MDEIKIYSITAGVVVVGMCGAIALTMWGCPQYDVWNRSMSGKAQLAEAQSNRQIRTLEAKAKLESAKYEAQAEVIRAEGVAKANRIIGHSMKGNQEYLHWLWVNNLENNKNAVYYVPTETGMPLMLKGEK